MTAHGFDRIDENEEHELVLVCTCGWQSPPRRTGAGLGEVWDEHRFEACA